MTAKIAFGASPSIGAHLDTLSDNRPWLYKYKRNLGKECLTQRSV